MQRAGAGNEGDRGPAEDVRGQATGPAITTATGPGEGPRHYRPVPGNCTLAVGGPDLERVRVITDLFPGQGSCHLQTCSRSVPLQTCSRSVPLGLDLERVPHHCQYHISFLLTLGLEYLVIILVCSFQLAQLVKIIEL